MARDDLAVAALAAFVGGSLEQVDKMTLEAVNKSAMDRSGGKSNRLDPRKFITSPQQGQPPPQYQPPPVFDGQQIEISNQINTIPIPDDLKEQAKKYIIQPTAPQPITIGNVQIQNGGINTPVLLLAMDKKLDIIVEKLDMICKTAKIVRK